MLELNKMTKQIVTPAVLLYVWTIVTAFQHGCIYVYFELKGTEKIYVLNKCEMPFNIDKEQYGKKYFYVLI